jgi:hypothetical protein
MVIIVSREGQFANRILHASSFIVNAKEHNYKVLHLFFDDYYPVFSEKLVEKKDLITFWGKKKTNLVFFCQQFLDIVVRIFLKLRIKKLPLFEIIEYKKYGQDTVFFDLNRDEFVQKAKSKLVLVYGWLFKDPRNLEKHKQLLLGLWQPNKNYLANVENYFQKYKQDHDVLVGVHIRRGDYKTFENGKWFYSPAQYYEKMKEIAMLETFRDKKIAFIICSNEKDLSFPHTDEFSIFNEERHFAEDVLLLSKCNYIIGPPSTFSIWASFYGDVPLCLIDDVNRPVSKEDFRKEYY